jgi:transcriptional regulator with XRE-family HTH domain
MDSTGQKIKAARLQKGFTQEALAELSLLSLRTIQRIEADENVPTAKTLNLISKALEIDVVAFSEIKVDFEKGRTLNIKLLLPYNWGHFRKIGLYGNDGKLITKIMHGETLQIAIDPSIIKIIVKLDIFRSEIEIPLDDQILFLNLYMDFRDYFPFQYIDTLKRKCLTGKFVAEDVFEQFDLSFYQMSKEWILKSKIDKSNLRLGLILSAGLIVFSIVEQENEYQELLFFISLVSFISLLMVVNERDKILAFDYKSRMVATGIAFFLASLLLSSPFYIVLVFLLFSFVFLLQSLREIDRK